MGRLLLFGGGRLLCFKIYFDKIFNRATFRYKVSLYIGFLEAYSINYSVILNLECCLCTSQMSSLYKTNIVFIQVICRLCKSQNLLQNVHWHLVLQSINSINKVRNFFPSYFICLYLFYYFELNNKFYKKMFSKFVQTFKNNSQKYVYFKNKEKIIILEK